MPVEMEEGAIRRADAAMDGGRVACRASIQGRQVDYTFEPLMPGGAPVGKVGATVVFRDDLEACARWEPVGRRTWESVKSDSEGSAWLERWRTAWAAKESSEREEGFGAGRPEASRA